MEEYHGPNVDDAGSSPAGSTILCIIGYSKILHALKYACGFGESMLWYYP